MTVEDGWIREPPAILIEKYSSREAFLQFAV